MLARDNRLQKAEHFRSTMKQGRKVNSDHLVIYLKRDEALAFSRFGFVVAKTIGGAVKRNLVKRRLRAIAREVLVSQDLAQATSEKNQKFDVVVRALPASAELEWNKLRAEMLASIDKALGKVA